jgi:hypothetical protein
MYAMPTYCSTNTFEEKGVVIFEPQHVHTKLNTLICSDFLHVYQSVFIGTFYLALGLQREELLGI